MEIITGSRMSGKTTALIKKSAKEKGVIVCHSQRDKQRIIMAAHIMKLKIYDPITYDELLRGKTWRMGKFDFYLEDINGFISLISEGRIKVVTLETSDNYSINLIRGKSSRIRHALQRVCIYFLGKLFK